MSVELLSLRLDELEHTDRTAYFELMQEAVDTGNVWQDEYHGKLAAGYIGSGLLVERRW